MSIISLKSFHFWYCWVALGNLHLWFISFVLEYCNIWDSCILCTILEKINNEFLFNFFQKQHLFSPHNHIFTKDMFYPTIFQRRIVINYSNSANMYWLSPICQLLAWKIPWMEESGGLQSMGPQRVGHNWVTSLSLSFTIRQP